MKLVEFDHVDIVFGHDKKIPQALAQLDSGADREKILTETGCVLGVANANLSIDEGEICVLMGLSGSGKSTLLRAVNRLNKVTRGHVRVADNDSIIDIVSCSDEVLCQMRMHRIAMVFQQFALLPWRTVEENVGLGLELRGVTKSERQKLVLEKLKLVQLEQWKDKYAHELSGGMQQRVGLARAFATDADILLMDEPFSALDPLIRNHLQDELLELQRKLKKTIIFVSHDLDEALKIGTHIAIMEAGIIVQYGTAEDIVLNPANEYVRQFVAHMNPLNVLRAASVMQKIEPPAPSVLLDSVTGLTVHLNEQQQTRSASNNSKQIPIVSLQAFDAGTGQQDCLVQAPDDILLRQAMAVRQQSGFPVLLERHGCLVGFMDNDDIYRAILDRQ